MSQIINELLIKVFEFIGREDCAISAYSEVQSKVPINNLSTVHP